MRVLLDYQAFTIQSTGGISRYVLELGARLAGKPGVDLRLHAGWHRSTMLRDAAPAWVSGRYAQPWPKTGPLRHALNRFLTRRFVRDWRPDLVHETYFRPGRAYAPGLPTVLTVHDLIYFVHRETDRDAACVRRAQLAAIARADHIICVSENTRNDLLRFTPADPRRVTVIPLAGPAAPAAPPPAPPAHAGPYLLFVGIRHSYKNFSLLLRALAAHPRLRHAFRVIAFGGGTFTSAETAQMRKLGLDKDRIEQRDGDDATLAAHYAHAAALVCPSLYEGFGLPLVEAMSHGCPVVCGDRGSLPEVAGDAALFFDPEDEEALARELHRLLDEPVRVTALREQGPRRAARFSWEACAEKTLAVYRLLAKDRA